MKKVALIHGPNLNLLGTREPSVYGTETLPSLNNRLCENAKKMGIHLTTFQSNAEHELIHFVQQARQEQAELIIINPGAFAHTSIALRDAFLAIDLPFIEIHISNIYAREAFRHHSFLQDIALGTMTGLGVYGYELALNAASHYLNQTRTSEVI